MLNTPPDNPQSIYTITRLNREIRSLLEGTFPILWVKGEISNLSRPASGHCYFSLKDASSQVSCAMFKNRLLGARYQPQNGEEVMAQVKISLYEARGNYQLIVERMEPVGAGALQKAFEELKQSLQKQGLFAEEHKKPIPKMPQTIGIISSASGAALRDILHVLNRRYPLADVILYPSQVQGEQATASLIKQVERAEHRKEVDVLILARGGGSIEDLWCFNDEGLARAIHACSIPVVTGIGHEIDFTIADFVADQRAPTPSAAAETVAPDQQAIVNTVNTYQERIAKQFREQHYFLKSRLEYLRLRLPHPQQQLMQISQRLDEQSMRLQYAMDKSLVDRRESFVKLQSFFQQYKPLEQLRNYAQQSEYLTTRLKQVISNRLETANMQLANKVEKLNIVSPLATLQRGYSITSVNNEILHSVEQVKEGDTITSRLSDGELVAEVIETR